MLGSTEGYYVHPYRQDVPVLQVPGLGDVSTSPLIWGLATAPRTACHPMQVSLRRSILVETNTYNVLEFNPSSYQVTPGRGKTLLC